MTQQTPHPMLSLTDEVATALRDGTPVVALESTIISHGMPYPQNVEMAVEVEGIVREHGAVRPRSPSSTAGRGSAWTGSPSSCWPATATS